MLALSSGCSDNPEDPEAFFNEFIETACTGMVECRSFPDIETCRETLPIEIQQVLAAVEAGLVTYHSDRTQECLDALRGAVTCEVLDAGFLGNDVPEHCDPVFTGEVEIGGSCIDSVECAGNAYCETESCPDACCAGVCVEDDPPPVRAEIGEDCGELTRCVDEAYCPTDGQTPVCTERVAVGQECQDFDSCVAGSFCDFDFQTLTGTCIDSLPGEGEACDPESFLACNRGDNYCHPIDAVCTAGVVPGGTCDEATRCVEYAYCMEGTCLMRPLEGESCQLGTDIDCLGDLDCVEGVCVGPDPEEVCPY